MPEEAHELLTLQICFFVTDFKNAHQKALPPIQYYGAKQNAYKELYFRSVNFHPRIQSLKGIKKFFNNIGLIFPTRECSACQWGNPQFLAAFSIAPGDGLVMS